MLVLAGGWGLPQPTFEDDQPTLLDINVDSVLGPLVDAANLVGYTLYPVDVPGFRATSSNDASVGTPTTAMVTPVPRHVIDEDGDRSETPIEKILISGPSKPEPGDVFYYETNLLLRRREHRFVAALYDPLTGAILSANGTVGP